MNFFKLHPLEGLKSIYWVTTSFMKKKQWKCQGVQHIVLLLENFISGNFTAGVNWYTVCKEDYRQQNLKPIDLRYFRKFIHFRANLCRKESAYNWIFSIGFCILPADIIKFKDNNRIFSRANIVYTWKKGLWL